MNDDRQSEFSTPNKYRMSSSTELTESMEDYIEMIYRTSLDTGYTRISQLSKMLNVSPSSASKMVHKLSTMKYCQFPKYGVIQLTENGRAMGEYLIWRHQTLEAFLCAINGTRNETKQVEQIEHYFDEKTIKNIEKATAFLKQSFNS